MKKKSLAIVALFVAVLAVACFCLTACNSGQTGETQTLRFAAPEGTPALAMLRLVTDNKTISGKNMNYEVVAPANIAVEMSGEKSDVLIMPINAGANLIRQGAQYKLLSVAVDGSLFLIGNKDGGNTITMDDLKGKKVACIGQTAVPGLVFRYVMKANNITLVSEGEPNAANNEVYVQYVSDGSYAKPLLQNGQVDYAVVGEPAATAFKNTIPLNAEMNLQTEYEEVSGKSSYPQAGLFVKSSLLADTDFIDGLFDALSASKAWTIANKTEVTTVAKANLYESAAFPPASIARCAINVERLTNESKADIVSFLSAIVPKDGQGNAIDWSSVALF